MKTRRLLGLVPIATAALVMSLAAPAAAATASVSAEGVSGTLNYRFSGREFTDLTITLSDTKCNAHPAVSTVTLYGMNSSQFQYVDYKNQAGCGTTRSYSTGLFRANFDIKNIRICVRGGGSSGCSNYLDNPNT